MKPNFFIVGAAKSGTTSLDRYLNQHPQIFMAPRKETHYFATPDMPDEFRGPGDEPFTANLIRDEAEFLGMFDGATTERVIGESSVYYLYYPKSAQRIANLTPEAKVVIVLRDPVDRAYSAYMHVIRDGRETLAFDQSVAREAERKLNDYQPLWFYREVGLYHEQVRHYLNVFGKEQTHIILYDEFNAHPDKTLHDLFEFLGVDQQSTIDTSIRYNATGVPMGGLFQLATTSNPLTRLIKPLVPAKLREKLRFQAKNMTMQKRPLAEDAQAHLRRYFADDVRRLEELLQRRLSAWT